MRNYNNEDYIEYQRDKKKKKKNKLLFVFFTTFAAALLVFTFMASVLTPKIDIPGTEEGDDSAVTSSDFKGRVDSSLKFIEMQEDSPNQNRFNNSSETQQREVVQQAQNTEMAPTRQSITTQQTDSQYGYNSEYHQQAQSAETYVDQDDSYIPPTKATSKPALRTQVTTQKAQTPQNNNSLGLRNKIQASSSSPSGKLVKVMVGSYATPSEAREASNQIVRSNPSVTPFIKESNGTYSLQVGSFTDTTRANGLANELKKQNSSVKVVND